MDDRLPPRGEDAEAFLDAAPCGLLTTAPDGTILSVNQALLDWLGYERTELVGVRRLDELFTLPSRIYFETHYAPLLRMQGFVKEIATDLRRNDGGILPAYLNSMEKRDEEGSVILVRTAVFDATDRRRYERELLLERRISEQAANAKADFLAMFAHEIRNPLGAVVLQVQLLERKLSAAAEWTAITRLRSSLDRIMTLINNMLDVSKLEAGKVTLEETAFDPRDVLQAVVSTLAPNAERKKIPLRVEVGEAVPERVIGDPVKLDQALTNLVGNAIKFTETGLVTLGAERIRTAGEVAYVHFFVRDTGIGIPAEKHALIFDPYGQADASVARRFGGTGLGLTITQKLLEIQGSRLRLKSAPGKGSTFSFDLALRLAALTA